MLITVVQFYSFLVSLYIICVPLFLYRSFIVACPLDLLHWKFSKTDSTFLYDAYICHIIAKTAIL